MTLLFRVQRACRAALLAGAACTASAADTAETARLVVDATNAFRDAQARARLDINEELREAAVEFARYMARTGKYGHEADGRTPVERAKAAGYEHCIVAENVAYQYRSGGYRAAGLARELVEGWKGSPGHRENMLDPAVTQTGVGVARGSDGRYFAVQMFGLPARAAVRFTVRNEGGARATYRLDERSYSLPARATRTHLVCRPPQLRLPRRDGPVTPEDGATYAIRAARG